MSLNICFRFLNNITRIFTHFFTHMYFQKNKNCYLNTRTKQTPRVLLSQWHYLVSLWNERDLNSIPLNIFISKKNWRGLALRKFDLMDQTLFVKWFWHNAKTQTIWFFKLLKQYVCVYIYIYIYIICFITNNIYYKK